MSFYPRSSVLKLIFLAMFVPSAMPQSDVVIIKNGDRITGEIKKLEKGVIHIDPDYGKNIFQIEWSEVKQIDSKESFVVESSSGRRISGLIQVDPEDSERLMVETDAGPVAVELHEIVWAQPFNRDFWSRFSAAVDLGASASKAAGSKQANLGSTVGYLEERYQLRGSFDWNRNIVGESKTNRWEANGQSIRLIRQRWFWAVTANFLQSDELQLQLRTTTAPGIGRFLKRTNRMYWNVAGGGQWTNERSQDPSLPRKNSGEGWAQTEFNLFDIGDLSLLTTFKVSPSFTDAGRVRLDFRSDVKYDFPKDLYVRFGLSDNFDSRPQGDTPKNDYVFSFGVGWEF